MEKTRLREKENKGDLKVRDDNRRETVENGKIKKEMKRNEEVGWRENQARELMMLMIYRLYEHI